MEYITDGMVERILAIETRYDAGIFLGNGNADCDVWEWNIHSHAERYN